jgi:hypothetical protein
MRRKRFSGRKVSRFLPQLKLRKQIIRRLQAKPTEIADDDVFAANRKERNEEEREPSPTNNGRVHALLLAV